MTKPKAATVLLAMMLIVDVVTLAVPTRLLLRSHEQTNKIIRADDDDDDDDDDDGITWPGHNCALIRNMIPQWPYFRFWKCLEISRNIQREKTWIDWE